MSTLLEIGQDMAALDELLDEIGGDLTDPQIEAYIDGWFAENEKNLKEKLDNYAGFITELEARAALRKEESKRLADKAKRDQASADFLKERLKRFFFERGLKKEETNRYTISLVNNGGKLPLIVDVEPEALPEHFQRRKIVISADQDAIRHALEEGEELPFARLGERGSSIRIR